MKTFTIKPIPSVRFGVDTARELPDAILGFGRRVLLVIGSVSITTQDAWEELLDDMSVKGIIIEIARITSEPTPEIVDTIVEKYRHKELDLVVALGGGSVLDGGKAISAMLAAKGSVEKYLEGVGDKKPNGKKVPFIAVPTTAGTGSEMTSNAVISRVGECGFKRSLRHDAYIPNLVIIDPSLALGCPQEITLNCTMDAFTQLVESYLSTKASLFTDDLAYGAITRLAGTLTRIGSATPTLEDRVRLAYGAYISGITLANAGLGAVHGFASVIGGLFQIPHGVVCGTLMASSNAATLTLLRNARTGRQDHKRALEKYVRLGKIFCQKRNKSAAFYQDLFIDTLQQLTADYHIKPLSKYGIGQNDLMRIAQQTGNKNNPIELSSEELVKVLESRLE